MNNTSARFFFESLAGAVEALLVVLEDARETDYSYRFGSLSADQVFMSGLMLVGQIDDVASKLEQIEGTTRYDD